MPKGRKHRFSRKEHREADHIYRSEIAKGFGARTAKRIAWSTVNKRRKQK